MKVFLGGTCNNSNWRKVFIPMLKMEYFNPVLEHSESWDEKTQELEKKEKEQANFILYVITPKMTGVYSIAEAVDDSNKRPEKTLFCVLENDEGEKFDRLKLKSLNVVKKLIQGNGSKTFTSLQDVSHFLNSQIKKE